MTEDTKEVKLVSRNDIYTNLRNWQVAGRLTQVAGLTGIPITSLSTYVTVHTQPITKEDYEKLSKFINDGGLPPV